MKGLIQGPEEFAAGLALGVKSLVGGTVGEFLNLCVFSIFILFSKGPSSNIQRFCFNF